MRRSACDMEPAARSDAMRYRRSRARPRRIAIVRALPGLGDMLCAIPAARALRAACPAAHVTLVGLPSSQRIVERFSRYFDELAVVPPWPGIPECEPLDPRASAARLTALQARGFDLAIQMHGSGIATNPLTLLLGAARTAGCHAPGGYVPDSGTFVPYDDREPEVLRWLRVVAHLGAPPLGSALEFPLHGAEVAERDRLFAGSPPLAAGHYVTIHPGSSGRASRWSCERFAAVADALAAHGLEVVLIGGDAERPLTRAVAARMRHGALDLCGRLSLGGLAAVIGGSRLLVANDTGTSHLAAALRVPSVVVFTRSDPARWAPLDHSLHRPLGGPFADVDPSTVVAVASDLLASEPTRAH